MPAGHVEPFGKDRAWRTAMGSHRDEYNSVRGSQSTAQIRLAGSPPIQSYTGAMAETYSAYLGLRAGDRSLVAGSRPIPLSVTGTTLSESLVSVQVPHESALDRVRSILHGVSQPSGRLTQHVHGVSKTEDHRPEEHHVSHQASHHSSHNEGHHGHALHQSTFHHPPQIHDGDGHLRHQEHFRHPSHLHQGHAHACHQGHSHVRGGYQGHAMSSNETVRPRPTRAHTVPLPGSHP
ncbi:hypothetical protein AK812_SmicGene26446 [Symbiodinium microadriaticum]|uniref:Uncharacterized protein n=1 Tax=Symbiodinium microadriaticum TaxID=2951 RepID=A0A1Q9D9C0_SYMMI|nr:hypothetical protein AK812_SmicGene26446 [Symbiodinium microadriaticum]